MNGRNFRTGIPGVDFLITFLQGGCSAPAPASSTGARPRWSG